MVKMVLLSQLSHTISPQLEITHSNYVKLVCQFLSNFPYNLCFLSGSTGVLIVVSAFKNLLVKLDLSACYSTI